MSKPIENAWKSGKETVHKWGHEIDKHVFNEQWTKGWRQGLTAAAAVAATIYTGGAAAGTWPR